MPVEPKTETYLVWKKFVTVEGEGGPRLLTPHSDPFTHEHPFNYYFEDVEKAYQGLDDFGGLADARDEEWVLCRVTIVPVERFDPAKAPPTEEA